MNIDKLLADLPKAQEMTAEELAQWERYIDQITANLPGQFTRENG